MRVSGRLRTVVAMADPAGYSGTPLDRKLGIAPDTRLALLGDPAGLAPVRRSVPEGVALASPAGRSACDVAVLAVRTRRELERALPRSAARIQPAGALWVVWPKKSSALAADLTEDGVRAVAIPAGLVDVKVCAVDADWSGLKLVVPLARRPKASGTRTARAGSKGARGRSKS